MRKQLFTLLFFLVTSFVVVSQTKEQINSIDQYFEKAIGDWNIPGGALAIVKDGEIIFEKGYGVKSVDTKDKVDENTLFAIASNSKAYTSAAIAQLVDEGLMSWDDKVKDYLPYFQLYDDCVTEAMTISDLLSHRSGLKTFSGDLLWYGTDYSREEVIRRARFLKPTYDFRTTYGYQNIMFIAAGEVIAKVSGMSWDVYIKQNFLDKLGMNSTVSSIRDFNSQTNKSEPHNENNGNNEVIDWINWDNIGGAGALITSAHDASQWMNLQLYKGTWKDEVFWTEKQSNNMWTVHTPKALSNWHRTNFPSKHFSGYGLGWDLFDYHGKLIVNHGGGYDGFISQTILVPEEKLGFIVMTNNNNSLSYAMMYQILDEFYASKDMDKTDWGAMFLNYKKEGEIEEIANLKKIKEERIKGAKPSANIANYAGYYEDEMYGGLTIKAREGVLYFNFDHTKLFKGTLEHWQDDTFRLYWGTKMMLPPGMANFSVDESGMVTDLIIDVPNPDFDFTEFHFFRKNKKKVKTVKQTMQQK